MDMQEQLRKIQEEAANQLENVRDKAGLDALRLKMLGKKGDLTQLLRSMGQLPAEERPKAGQMINVVRERLTEQMDALDSKIKRIEQEKKLEREAIDVTEPRKHAPIGSIHPVSLVQDQLLKVFTGMGFDVVEGPEVELDLFNFELLNLPKNHPARDAQDTFYIEDNIVLRTHTSPVQAQTADPHCLPRPRLSRRRGRRDAFPGVPSDGGPGHRRRCDDGRFERYARHICQGALWRRCNHALPPELLPVHRAVR